MAEERRYSESNPLEQIGILMRERPLTIACIQAIQTESYRNTAYHPERGLQTVEDYIDVTLGHDLYHIEQLSGYL